MDSWKRDKAFRDKVRIGRARGLSNRRSERFAVYMLMLDEQLPDMRALRLSEIPRTPSEFKYVGHGRRQIRRVRDATTGRFISATDIGASASMRKSRTKVAKWKKATLAELKREMTAERLARRKRWAQ